MPVTVDNERMLPELKRSKEFLKHPMNWIKDFFTNTTHCCVKSYRHGDNKQRFGVIFSNEPLTVHVRCDDEPDKMLTKEIYPDLDALVANWIVD